jgi:hypothetical protein
MTTIPFTHKSSSFYPGAFLINSGNGSFPIFCSIDNFSTWGMNDIDNYYLVMPGYKLLTYPSSGYVLSSTTSQNGIYDNTTGESPLYYNSTYADHGSSCKLYFKGNEIKVSGISDTNPQA